MNNRGFAISGILYAILILFLMVLLSLLSILTTKIKRFEDLSDDIRNNLEDANNVTDAEKLKYSFSSEEISEEAKSALSNPVDDNIKYYITPYRGKYTIKLNDNTDCYVYLPKKVLLFIDNNKKIKYIDADVSSDSGYTIGQVPEGASEITFTTSDCNLIDVTKFEIIAIDTSFKVN